MADQSIGSFINAFNGGTRPNRFRISGTSPAGNIAIETHCMASTLPDSTLGVIPLPFRGRIYKFPGDRDYQPWNITILDDVGENDVYASLHAWSEIFNNHETNLAATRKHITQYSTDLTVSLLDHNSGTELRTFTLHHAWPISVGAVELNMATANAPITFPVQLAYSYFTVTAVSPTNIT